MAMTKTVQLDRIDVNMNSGFLEVRFMKRIMDGDKEMFREPHRTAFAPGQSVELQMGAVNAHLEAMGWPSVDDYSAIEAHGVVAWTPEVVAAWEAQQAALAEQAG